MKVRHSITATLDNSQNTITFYVGNSVDVRTADSKYFGIISSINENYISLRHPGKTGSFINIGISAITHIAHTCITSNN